MTGDKKMTDEAMEALFAEAREAPPPLSDELRARILADADVAQAHGNLAVRRQVRSAPARLLSAIGGWSGLGGLAAATVAGIWIGFANPTVVFPDATEAELVQLSEDDLLGDIFLGDSLFFEEG